MKSVKNVWNYSSKQKRRELLRVLGYRSEWAKLSWDEMGKRGGGMLLNDLTRLNKIRMRKSPLKKTEPKTLR